MFSKNLFTQTARTALCALLAMAAWTSPAKAAALSYNYTQSWLFDSASGLYWQRLPFSTSTFVPEFGTIATYEQLTGLFAQVGQNLSSGQSSSGPYSLPLADLLSFFKFGTPAESVPNAVPGQPYLQVSAYYEYSPLSHLAPNNHEVAMFIYTYVPNATLTPWQFEFLTTIGLYGPGRPTPCLPSGCPATELGFVVSTVQPVPLPGALWLLISGLGVLGLVRRKQAT